MSLPKSLADADRAKTIEDMFDLAGASVSPSVARLVSTSGGEPIEICDERHVVGRSKELPLGYRIEHPRLSSHHCEILLNKVTNVVHIVDTSTNGVFVNGSRIAKGEKVELQPGDGVCFLNKSIDAEAKLDFLFQRIKKVVASTDVAEELTCAVCKGTLYKPVASIPCMHTFCAGCVSEWLKHSTNCPECRAEMYELRPSHKVGNLVEEFLKTRPELKRTAAEIADLDAKDVVPPTGMKVKGGTGKRGREAGDVGAGPHGSSDDDGDDSDLDDGSDEEEDEEDDDHGWHGGGGGVFRAAWRGPLMAGPPGAIFHPMPGFPPRAPIACPQCHAPAADGFQCPPGGSHLNCLSCHSSFPDRPMCGIAQKCFLCSMPFCDLYLGGCKNPAGVGYLQPLKDHRMDALPTAQLFNGNRIEQDILQRHLHAGGIGAGTAWLDCLKNLGEGAWKPDIASVRGPVTPEVCVCKPCANRIFAALLVNYRRAIPRDALPPAVANRPDCWYGLQCRTQFSNPVHAQKYNHVCNAEKRKE